ncbi:MAG: sodium:solute symporter [Bacteroidetes bacterium]|nr:MAG: sodium:solute symporter [Bacteroidota bacterium]PTM14904.1 MAG: sodium:solute symporter [Bacteroidota bacterium]
MTVLNWQWLLVALSGLIFLLLSPVARNTQAFFSAASARGSQPGVFMLTSSLVISWIFAKSITNAANLGLSFGLVGGVAYAVYYLSFIVAGIVIHQMRIRGGFTSIHHFLATRFGHGAVVVFSLLVGFRLYNEVWSNTMVIGSYFGAAGSANYYGSILLFTGLTLAYTLKGGLRSSMLTDVIQMVLFGLLLFVVLGLILPKTGGGISTYLHSGEWTMATGLNLAVVAFIQIFSYPFHDSVMTDRGFISDPKVTLRSFLWAAPIGFVCIVLFSFVGIYAQAVGLEGQAPVEVSKVLGVGAMLVMNFIMITSAGSTLDSAFSSAAKLVVKDLGASRPPTVLRGRIVMALFAVAGTLPIFANPEILSATTVSGTMVLGLAPVFLLWRWQAAGAWSFHLAVGVGVVLGLLLALGLVPASWVFFSGKYGDLLSVNIIGTVLCFVLFAIPLIIKKSFNAKE